MFLPSKPYLLVFLHGISNSTCDNRVKINKITQTIIFSIPRVDIEASPPDNAPVATDMRGEEDEARADVNNSTEE